MGGDWIKWLIPLIAVAVWVLTTMVRNREEPRRPVRPGTPPADGGEPPPGGPRPRRSAAEIEEFLQEVRRRREAGEQRKKKIPAREEPRREREPPRTRPSLTAAEPMAPPPPPPAPASLSPAPRPRERRDVTPLASTVVPAREEVVVARVVEPAPSAPSAYSVSSAPAAVGALLPHGRARGLRGGPAQLLQMLRQPQSLAAAIVLREILEPPVSRRRRDR